MQAAKHRTQAGGATDQTGALRRQQQNQSHPAANATAGAVAGPNTYSPAAQEIPTQAATIAEHKALIQKLARNQPRETAKLTGPINNTSSSNIISGWLWR